MTPKQPPPTCRYVKEGSTFVPVTDAIRALLEQGYGPKELIERLSGMIEVMHKDIKRQKR